jgi:N-acyl-D-amino-acid deacylase
MSYISDIGIKDGYIKSISPHIDTNCTHLIDAKGYITCPGFIDIDSHSDFSLFSNSKAESKVRQGITTEVVGQGGHTLAPLVKNHLLELKEYTHSYVQNNDKTNFWNWKSQTEFINILGKRKLAVNIASLVGYGTIRIAAMGFEKRKP